MPGSHSKRKFAARTPCDKFVCDFRYDFGGIVGSYGICVHIVYGHRAISSTGQSPQSPHGNRTVPVRGSAFARCIIFARAPCGDCATLPTTCLRATSLRLFPFKSVKLLANPNRRGRPLSHSRSLPPQGGLAVAARKGGYGQDTGPVGPSQSNVI